MSSQIDRARELFLDMDELFRKVNEHFLEREQAGLLEDAVTALEAATVAFGDYLVALHRAGLAAQVDLAHPPD